MLAAGSLRAQNYFVHLHRVDGSDSSLVSLLKIPAEFGSEAAALDFVRHIPEGLQEAGYLAASVDSFWNSGSDFHAQVFVGKRWHWVRLSLENLPPGLRAAAGISETQFAGRPLSPKALSAVTNRVLDWCEDHGYPFARVGLDSIAPSGESGISARLLLHSGRLYRIDSIVVEGELRLSKSYLMRYLDIREGAVYSESRMRQINLRLRELPFVDAASSAAVVFRPNAARLQLYLRERRANQLNAIIGLQPNSAEAGKLMLTVDAQAAFQNLLAQGESFSFSFQNLQPKSPRIRADAVYPFVLGTPLGADGNFDLYVRNTEFRRISTELGGRYALNALDYIRLYYRGNSNRVITPDTAFVQAFHRLPDNIDVSSAGGGLELSLARTDYRPNPTRGWNVTVRADVLRRTILRNDGITEMHDGSGFNYSKLYDSLDVETQQMQLRADAAKFFRLASHIVLVAGYSGGWMSGGRLFQNELFQLGGLRRLRGFDEGSLFASQYHIATAELRLLLSRNSHFYVFSDNAWLQSNINGFVAEGFYYGLGLGAALDTKNGVFSIACALGKSPDGGFRWREAKIHVGYVAYF
jgi:outer membrane protein assembly factor BamA